MARITVTLSFSSRLTLFGRGGRTYYFFTQVCTFSCLKIMFWAGVRCPEVEGERSKCEIYWGSFTLGLVKTRTNQRIRWRPQNRLPAFLLVPALTKPKGEISSFRTPLRPPSPLSWWENNELENLNFWLLATILSYSDSYFLPPHF